MIIRDFNIVCISISKSEADTPLIVYGNIVVIGECFDHYQ